MVPVQESQVPEEGIVDDFDDADSSLEQDISLAPVILANDEENKDFLTSESSQVVQVKVDLQDGTSSLLHDYEETSKSDPTLEEV